MKRLSSRFHLALGMSALVVTLLLAALFVGLVPDRDGAVRAGRTALAESVAALLRNPVLLDQQRAAALRFASAHRGATQRTQAVIDGLLANTPVASG